MTQHRTMLEQWKQNGSTHNFLAATSSILGDEGIGIVIAHQK